MGDSVLKSEENKIPFTEIKTYEEAYYYNSDPKHRMNYEKYDKYEVKQYKKKKLKVGKTIGEVIGDIIEGALEMLFSFLD